MDTSETVSILGPLATFKGEFTFEGNARIQGTVEGTISSTGEVRVEQGGFVKGNIYAATICIDGKVEGDLTATERLELLSHAEAKGDIACRTLVVVQGAAFVGHVNVGPDVNTSPRAERASGTARAGSALARPVRSKPDADWSPEVSMPLTGVASPVTRIPEWAGQGAQIARPAWMTGEPKQE